MSPFHSCNRGHSRSSADKYDGSEKISDSGGGFSFINHLFLLTIIAIINEDKMGLFTKLSTKNGETTS